MKTRSSLFVDLQVPCRKCRNCLNYRRRYWTARAITEYRLSARTWLATLTLNPGEHDQILNLCRHREAERNQDFDELSEFEQFTLRHNRISPYLTRWLKRVRKNSGARLRYMMVAEAHKNKLPHYHALIHEPEIDSRVTKHGLETTWPHGFTNFKLLPQDEPRGATYACKYLSKSQLARVRASLAYGTGQSPGHPKLKQEKK